MTTSFSKIDKSRLLIGQPQKKIDACLVLGLGRSGIAAIELLQVKGIKIIAADDADTDDLRHKAIELQSQGVEVHIGGIEPELADKVDLVVVSPGLPWRGELLESLRRRETPIIGELELASWFAEGRIAAVTGSNGKTTTTDLLGVLLKTTGHPAWTCGNIGFAFSAAVAAQIKAASEKSAGMPGLNNVKSFFAVEVSSFQLESIIHFHPQIGIILNITHDHDKEHGGFDKYVQAKSRLWLNQNSDDFLIYNSDDAVVHKIAGSARSRKIPVSVTEKLEAGAWLDGDSLKIRWLQPNLQFEAPRQALLLPGRHNVFNALCALTAGLLMGVSPESAKEVIKTYRGVPHRLETIRELNGVLYINDSKSTNVDAGRCALKAISRPIILIAGGRAKSGGFKELRPYIQEKVKKLILIGEAAEEIAADLGDLTGTIRAQSLSQALQLARQAAQAGDVVLLSPLAASFDMFLNYEDRGDQFRSLVMELKP